MTELLINNQRVVLPKNFNTKIVKENPFFTKSGGYSFDIVISLKSTVNTLIFKHVNRINIVSNMESMSACLIVDNNVELNGTAVIMEISDTEVKLQLLSGNSELNYLVGGDKKLRDLELGTCPYFFYLEAKDSLYRTYPLANFVYTPVYSRNLDMVYNFFLPNYGGTDHTQSLDYWWYLLFDCWLAQPYLCFIIERILFISGYILKHNDISETKYKNAFIVNGSITNVYAKMLPDWTVADFFTEIEKLLNVVIVINENNKDFEILFSHKYYENAPVNYISKVLDEYSVTIEKDNTISHTSGNIGYELSDNDYFKFQRVNPDIVKNGQRIEFANYAAIKSHINSTINKDSLKNKIFYSIASETEYIAYWDENDNIYPKKINIFKDIVNNLEKEDIDVELKITPAEMTTADIIVSNNSELLATNFSVLWTGIAQMPIIDTDPSTFINNPDFLQGPGNISNSSLQDLIEGNESLEEKNVNNKLQLAFYEGLKQMTPKGKEANPGREVFQYPMSFVDHLSEIPEDAEIQISDAKSSLRLTGNLGLDTIYSQGLNIDTTEEFTFKFESSGKIDIRSVFVIRNKEFVCKQIQLDVTANGLSPVVEGVFYPVKERN